MLDAHKAEVKRALKGLRTEGASRAFYCAQTSNGPILHVTLKKVSAKRFSTVSGLNKQYKKYKGATEIADDTPFIAGKVVSAEGVLVFVPKVKKNSMTPAGLTRALRKLRKELKLPAYRVGEAVALGSSSGAAANAAVANAAEIQARVARASRCSTAEWQALERDVAAFVALADARTAKKLQAAMAVEAGRRTLISKIRSQQPFVPTMDDAQLASLAGELQAYQKAGGTEDVSAIAATVREERALRVQELRFAAVLRDLRVPDMSATELDTLEQQIKAYNAQSGVMDLSELEQQISDERFLRADAIAVMSAKVEKDALAGRSLRSRLQGMLGGPLGTAERKALAGVLDELRAIKAGLEGYREDVLLLV